LAELSGVSLCAEATTFEVACSTRRVSAPHHISGVLALDRPVSARDLLVRNGRELEIGERVVHLLNVKVVQERLVPGRLVKAIPDLWSFWGT
jgi:hypothetical protein